MDVLKYITDTNEASYDLLRTRCTLLGACLKKAIAELESEHQVPTAVSDAKRFLDVGEASTDVDIAIEEFETGLWILENALS